MERWDGYLDGWLANSWGKVAYGTCVCVCVCVCTVGEMDGDILSKCIKRVVGDVGGMWPCGSVASCRNVPLKTK